MFFRGRRVSEPTAPQLQWYMSSTRPTHLPNRVWTTTARLTNQRASEDLLRTVSSSWCLLCASAKGLGTQPRLSNSHQAAPLGCSNLPLRPALDRFGVRGKQLRRLSSESTRGRPCWVRRKHPRQRRSVHAFCTFRRITFFLCQLMDVFFKWGPNSVQKVILKLIKF